MLPYPHTYYICTTYKKRKQKQDRREKKVNEEQQVLEEIRKRPGKVKIVCFKKPCDSEPCTN